MGVHAQVPDIRIFDAEGDGTFTVELSVPVGERKRRFVAFECADRDDAGGLAASLLRRSQSPCRGDALDALLGDGLTDE